MGGPILCTHTFSKALFFSGDRWKERPSLFIELLVQPGTTQKWTIANAASATPQTVNCNDLFIGYANELLRLPVWGTQVQDSLPSLFTNKKKAHLVKLEKVSTVNWRLKCNSTTILLSHSILCPQPLFTLSLSCRRSALLHLSTSVFRSVASILVFCVHT